MIIAIVMISMLYAYWYSCRANAMAEKEKLADLAVAYIDSNATPKKMKDMTYACFVGAGKWWFFPVLCVVLPLALLMIKEHQTIEAEEMLQQGDDVRFQSVMDSVMAVNFKRRPITSACFGALALIIAAFSIMLKKVFGGLKKTPNIRTSLLTTVFFFTSIRKKLHV